MHGQRVGTASCDFVTTAQGYKSTSIVRVTMQGLDYSLSKAEKLSAANELEDVMLSAVVNGEAVTLSARPQSSQVILDFSASGRKITNSLPAHAGAVLLPDFDPGALQTLLAIAAERNNRGLWAIIPKQKGAVDPVQLATYADQQGSLNGKPITVHHLVATIADANTDLFSDAQNRLLQAELPQEGFAIVRKGFVLKPAERAGAPTPQ